MHGFLSMSLGMLGTSLLGNLLSEKGGKATGWARGTVRAGDWVIKAGEGAISAGQRF